MNFTRIITDFFVRRYLEKARICFSAYNIWNFKIEYSGVALTIKEGLMLQLILIKKKEQNEKHFLQKLEAT